MDATELRGRLDDIEKRFGTRVPWCVTALEGGIRYLQRNTETLEYYQDGADEPDKSGNLPARYDGAPLAELRNLLPDIITTLDRVEAKLAGVEEERDEARQARDRWFETHNSHRIANDALGKANAEMFKRAVEAERRAEASEAALSETRRKLKAEEKRNAELLLRLDKARQGHEPDFCYDPSEWEFTVAWEERDQVHGYGDALPLGAVMQVATLIRGPRKWAAHVPVTWDDSGDPDETAIRWFDSEEAAEAARQTRSERLKDGEESRG